MTAPSRPALPGRVLLSVLGLVAMALGCTVFIAASLIQRARDASLTQAQEQVARFATGARTGLDRSLLGVDVLLASVDDLLISVQIQGHPMVGQQVGALLRSGVEQAMLVRSVTVLTTDGAVIASTDVDAPALALPQGFLQRVLQSALYTVLVSDPVRVGEDAQRMLYFARTVKLADGGKWVTVAQVPVDLLTTIMVQGTGASGLEGTLERSDGKVLASAPETLANAAGASESLEDLLAAGTVEQRHSRLSGAEALVTARRTLYRSLWLTTALPLERALEHWEYERRVILGAASVVIALILLGGAFALWYLSRLGRANAILAESKQVLDRALNSMTSGFFLLDSQNRLVHWNQRYEQIVPGLKGRLKPLMSFRDAFALVAREALPDADAQARSAWMQERETHLLGGQGQKEIRYPNGQLVQVSLQRTPDGGTVCVIHDVTEERKDQVSLRIAAIAFESQEGMLVTDAQRRILRVNKAFCDITGYSAEDVMGNNPRLLSSGRHDAAFYRAMWQSIADTGSWQGEILNRRKGAQVFPVHLTITAVKDDAGMVTHYVATMLDITQRKAAAEEIERLAYHDPLTGLPNRRLLMDRLQQALASSARTGRNGALLFLDLDHFKVLNDTLGHDFGDLLLGQVAQRLSSAVREGDTVARLGGDEFVVLLEDMSEQAIEAAEQSKNVGEKVLSQLSQPYGIASRHHHSSCSIGAVLFNGQHQSVDELLKQADLAMYDAKTAGRNALRFFDPQMQASVSARADMERELRVALAEQQFVLHYQPQVTHQGQVVGAEALIRWQHPRRGLVSPMEFIPLAEETGQILPIGLWVLKSACAQLKHWESVAGARAWRIAVNVSARQFHQTDFVAQVVAVLQQTGARPQLLKLELTESVVLNDVADASAKMNTLKALGVSFALDDFGTGQSSLSYLTQLPLDQLKIDQSFVRHMDVRPNDALMVQTIIGMAHNLGLEVIAEGVETQAQRALLEQHGCTLYQGYLFGRPVPLQEFERSLS